MTGRWPLALIPLLALFAPPAGAATTATDDYPLIAAAIKSGRLYQAAIMLDRAPPPSDQPTAMQLASLKAEWALASGDNEQALKAFTTLDAEQPDKCPFIRGIGLASARLGDRSRAVATLRRYTASCPGDWRAWDALAVMLALDSDETGSAAAHRQALALAPDEPTVLNNIATSLIRQHRFDEALVHLRHAIVLAPGDERIVNNLDIALASTGVAPTRNTGTDDAHRWAERLNNAGYAAMQAGRLDDARRLLSQAMRVDPIYARRTAANLARMGKP